MSTTLKVVFAAALKERLIEQGLDETTLESRLDGKVPSLRLTGLLAGEVTPSVYEAYLIAKGLNIPLDDLVR
jgi:hypothetical protein